MALRIDDAAWAQASNCQLAEHSQHHAGGKAQRPRQQPRLRQAGAEYDAGCTNGGRGDGGRGGRAQTARPQTVPAVTVSARWLFSGAHLPDRWPCPQLPPAQRRRPRCPGPPWPRFSAAGCKGRGRAPGVSAAAGRQAGRQAGRRRQAAAAGTAGARIAWRLSILSPVALRAPPRAPQPYLRRCSRCVPLQPFRAQCTRGKQSGDRGEGSAAA